MSLNQCILTTMQQLNRRRNRFIDDKQQAGEQL